MARGGNSAALLTLAALAAFLFSSKARAQSTQAEPGPAGESEPPFAPYAPWEFSSPDDPLYPLPAVDLTPIDFPALDFDSWLFDPLPNIMPIQNPDNLAAFLYMIKHAEHDDAKAASGECYFTFYGNSSFVGTWDHPVITGEKKGVRLSNEMCRNAGFGPGCVSTAAGAYQIIKPTWLRVRAAGAWGPRLPDFSPASQDEAARRLLIESGAMPYIEKGDIEKAIQKASKLWASLPGNPAKQPKLTVDRAIAYFDDGLRAG